MGEGAGENDRALSVQSDDELAGGLDPDDEMGMPPEYLEDHEPNKSNDVIDEEEQWKLVCRRKNKRLFKTFQKKQRIRLSLRLALLVSLLVCQVPGP